MKVVLTGAAGMVGSRFFDLLKGKYEITPLSGSFGVDITDKNKVKKFLADANPAVIVHMAAATNVDRCEEDRESDIKKLKKAYNGSNINYDDIDPSDWKGSTSAFGVNTLGTKNIADFAKENSVKMIYFSTDFVFDGESDTPYSEEDAATPIDWYGQTKYFGEKVLPEDAVVARISYPFGYRNNNKKDLVWTFADLLSKNSSLSLVSDQIITPTFIDDIVHAIDFLIKERAEGIYHVVGNTFLSPYEFGIAVAREFGYPEDKIEATTRAKFYKGRAPRPFKVRLKNDKLKAAGFEMTDFYEALRKIK